MSKKDPGLGDFLKKPGERGAWSENRVRNKTGQKVCKGYFDRLIGTLAFELSEKMMLHIVLWICF